MQHAAVIQVRIGQVRGQDEVRVEVGAGVVRSVEARGVARLEALQVAGNTVGEEQRLSVGVRQPRFEDALHGGGDGVKGTAVGARLGEAGGVIGGRPEQCGKGEQEEQSSDHGGPPYECTSAQRRKVDWGGMPIHRALLLAAALAAGLSAEAPKLVRHQHRVDLIVDGKPWLMLGGELRNSSTSKLEFLQPIWPHLRALHLNTVFAPVSWKQMEPAEGRFDFTLVDGLIDGARRHDLRLALLWLATWKNGVSGYAPEWVMLHPERFTRLSATTLSPFGAATAEADARAFAALLRHLREIDGERNTVLMVQVENELGVLGASRDRSRAAEAAFSAAVPRQLLDNLAANQAALKPHLRELWQANGGKSTGAWRDIFGPRPRNR